MFIQSLLCFTLSFSHISFLTQHEPALSSVTKVPFIRRPSALDGLLFISQLLMQSHCGYIVHLDVSLCVCVCSCLPIRQCKGYSITIIVNGRLIKLECLCFALPCFKHLESCRPLNGTIPSTPFNAIGTFFFPFPLMSVEFDSSNQLSMHSSGRRLTSRTHLAFALFAPIVADSRRHSRFLAMAMAPRFFPFLSLSESLGGINFNSSHSLSHTHTHSSTTFFSYTIVFSMLPYI